MPNSLDISSLTLSHPARVQRIDVQARQSELLTIVKESHALEPSIFDENPPFFWRAQISNSNLDAYFTRMSESTLRNYADDAQAGVAFLRGHNWMEIPIGRSLSGELLEQDGTRRVLADFYTISGLPETDQLIAKMRSGVLKDVSVGFFGGKTICNLCQRDFWSCPHVPGLTYEIKDGDVVRQQLATFTIEGAHLAEVSGVYDGATPGAVILKAQQEAEAGRIQPEQVRILEQRYRIHLPERNRAFAGVDITDRAQPTTPGEDSDMTDEEVTRIQTAFARLGLPISDDVAGSLETIAERLVAADARVKDLEPQAAEGRQYRADMIAAALTEGVRAFGQGFDKPGWQEDLQRLSLERVKSWRDMWQDIADATLPGGRQTVDDDQTPTNHSQPAPRSMVPEGAFQG